MSPRCLLPAALATLLALGLPPAVCAAGGAAVPARVSPGALFLVRIPAGARAPEAVLFLGKTYPPLALPAGQGVVFLLGTDLDAAPGAEELLLRYAAGPQERHSIGIEPRRFPEERLTLPPAMVTPPKELEERIAREQALAAEVYRTSAAAGLWEDGFMPALEQRAAGNFGKRRILNGLAKSPHAGQDYTAPRGTPVRAVARGRVRICGDWYYSGRTILVDHGAGLVSQYLHLESMLVAEGDIVGKGQVIGRVGSTGRATGPHLHLGLRLFEQRVDPETLWGVLARKPGAAASGH